MKRRMKNSLLVTCKGVDLTLVSDIEFYVRQQDLFFQYTPEVTGANEMVVTIPFADAMRLRAGTARLQFAYLDETGTPGSSEIVEKKVDDLLKEAGYDPI